MSNHARPCGCCTPSEWSRATNRPGLTRLDYRFAGYRDFLRQMLGGLHRTPVDGPTGTIRYPLSRLTTRSPDDPVIAVLDAAAVIADILTFYQERIANESFLGTATERRSVLELARSIGYELHPGASAQAYLSFVLDDSERRETTIPTGTKVDSMPEGGDLPQTFETKTSLRARSEWNTISPLGSIPQTIALVDGEPRLFSQEAIFPEADQANADSASFRVVSGPKPTGMVWTIRLDVLRLDGTGLGIRKGDRILFVGGDPEDLDGVVVRAEDVTIDDEHEVTLVYLDSDAEPTTVSLPVDPASAQTPPTVTPGLDETSARTWIRDRRWRDSDLASFLTAAGWDDASLTRHLATPVAEDSAAEHGVYAFRERVPVFGHNAPLYSSLPVVTSSGDIKVQFRGDADPFLQTWDGTAGWSIFQAYPTGGWPNGGIRLARVVPDIAVGSWIVLEERSTAGYEMDVRRVENVWDESVTGFSLTGEVTALSLSASVATTVFTPRVRKTSVFLASRRLPLASLPMHPVLDQPDSGGAETIVLDGLYIGLRKGQPVAVRGVDADLEGVERGEIVTVERVEHHHGRTVLFLSTALRHRYRRSSVVLNANTVSADHGVTDTEVIGSGQATQRHQRFDLPRTSPARLTHVAAATPSGVEPALEVRVNGVRWQRVDALFGRGPSDQVYEVRIADDGEASVVFGDGSTGGRLPTGADNVTATYRVGVGADGEVGPEALQLLPARPEWVNSVTNPEGASGAEDPERLEDARRNAPLTVRTLDRVVSVSDYQDFARSFAGIGKARADRVWDGRGEMIVVTVGSATGAPLSATSPSVRGLADAIERYRDPVRAARVVPLAERTFDIAAKVIVDDRFEREDVLAQVGDRLRQAYSYQERDIGEDVTKSSVLTAIHAVDGVIAVDLDLFAATGVSEVAPLVEALPARWGAGAVRPAHLLLLNPVGLSLTGVTS